LKVDQQVQVLLSARSQELSPGHNFDAKFDEDLAGRLRACLPAFLVTLGYCVGTVLGFALTPSSEPISTLWPPNAILLAGLLLTSRRKWWILVLAVLPSHFAIQLARGVPLSTAGGWFVGNVGEALFAAACISSLSGKDRLFTTIRGVLVFLGFGVFLSPLVTSFVDAAVVVTTGWGNNYWVLWTTRLFSNMLASLTLVPTIVLVAVAGLPRIERATLSRWSEGALLAVTISLVSSIAFGLENMLPNSIPALVYAPLPLLLWASLRFGSAGLSASLLVVSIVSVLGAMHGRGPFTSTSIGANILALQALLCSIGVPLLMLSTVMVERHNTEKSLRQTSGKLIDAQERERHRIARELHDDIGQQLALVEIELGQLREEAESALKQQLENLSSRLSAVSKATHEISHGLHPTQLEYLGLATALDTLCHTITAETTLLVHFQHEGLPDLISPNISLCLFRVAQEALHNTAKHGHARHADVLLQAQAGHLLLRIVDDGIGFQSEQHAEGLGLTSMRERLHAVGGIITITSSPSGGTMIKTSVPLAGPVGGLAV
jgi:signal transduction histidine kinase